MTKHTQNDEWAEWLLHSGTAGDKEGWVDSLQPIRNRVLENAQISDGETLLDVGAGDGLIAFGALESLGDQGRVIFSDVSQDLLDHSKRLAEEMGVVERCRFVRVSATDLSTLADASVDVTTTRSVLIYVEDKERAFKEFYRVLKPSGRLSIFEPLNNFKHPEPPSVFGGYDVTPVRDLADRIKTVYEKLQPKGSHPLYSFDEQDLLRFAEDAGFQEIHMDYRVDISSGNPPDWKEGTAWDIVIKAAPNPQVPSLEEVVRETLTATESKRFLDHLRPLVEEGKLTRREACVYLWAVKSLSCESR